MVNKSLLPPCPRRLERPSPCKAIILAVGTAFALTVVEPRLGRALAVRRDPISHKPGRAGPIGSSRGERVDGERASHRTFAADGFGTADGCRRQQRRERQYDRLQGRQVAV